MATILAVVSQTQTVFLCQRIPETAAVDKNIPAWSGLHARVSVTHLPRAWLPVIVETIAGP